MSTQLSVSGIKPALTHFLRRFHAMIFVVFVLGSLSAGVFFLYQVIVTTDQSNGYTSNVNDTSFDVDTMNRLKALKDPGEITDQLKISGRSNPLSE